MKEDLYNYISRLDKKGELPFKVKKKEIRASDEYNSEEEISFIFNIGDNKYEVGWWSKIEDAEDWAQAESYNGDIFIKNDKYVYSSEIFEDIKKYLQIERDSKLNKLLKDDTST
jgi:hypothetical protein